MFWFVFDVVFFITTYLTSISSIILFFVLVLELIKSEDNELKILYFISSIACLMGSIVLIISINLH